MSTRFDVCSPRPRKNSDKPFWHRVGTAWKNDRGVNIVFDSLPLPDKEGRVSVALFEVKEKADAIDTRSGDDMNDQIPF